MSRLTPEQADLVALVRHDVRAVDAVHADLADTISFRVRQNGSTKLTATDRVLIRREITRDLNRMFGATQAEAVSAPMTRTIMRELDGAGTLPFDRAMQRVKGIADGHDPVLWRHLTARAVVGGNERDPFLRVLGMMTGPHVDAERAKRAGLFDPQRRWVQPGGYRLSDRVWKIGQQTRRAIDDKLRQGIARGMSAIDLANELEAYLNPEYAPLRYRADGSIVRGQAKRVVTQAPYQTARYRLTLPDQGHGSTSARLLARTEITRVHGVATIESAKVIPGVAGVRWLLSARHPAPDRCDDNASRDAYDLGRGVYPPSAVPHYPTHPADICTLSHAHLSRRETLDLIVQRYGGTA